MKEILEQRGGFVSGCSKAIVDEVGVGVGMS